MSADIVLRPEDMPSAPPGGAPDANYQPASSATNWLTALLEIGDTIRHINRHYPYRVPVVALGGQYGWASNGAGLNWTGIDGVEFIGRRGQTNPSDSDGLTVLPGAATQVLHDFTGSRNIVLRGVNFNCDNATVPQSQPFCGLLFARSILGQESNQITIERSTISGPFTAAPIVTHGTEELTIDRSWIVVNGAPVGVSAIYAGTTNGYGFAGQFLAVYQGQIIQDTVLTISGGLLQNKSPHDAYALTLDGACIVNLEHTTLTGRTAAIRLTGPNPVRHLKVTGGTKLVGEGTALQYAVQQLTPAVPEVITLDGFLTDAAVAIYRQDQYASAVKDLTIKGFTAPASTLALDIGGHIEHSHLYCQGHGVNVGAAIDGTNRLYSPGVVSAPGGYAAGVMQA